MLHIDRHLFVASLDEAAALLAADPHSAVLGGCGFLRLGARRIGTAIDLSRLDLDFIRADEASIEIGAMTSLRTVETHPLTAALAGGVLARALAPIVGVQLRHSLTVGGTVAGRYPFSDLLTALVALDARVELHAGGRIALADLLNNPSRRDIVVRVLLPRDERRAAFADLRRSATDFPLLNAAVARCADGFRVVVGSRPGRARRSPAAETHLADHGLDRATAAEAGRLAAAELPFGDNPRGSGAYRQSVCPVLVQRALLEVLHAG